MVNLPSKDYFVKKLNEDDILEILLEHFQEINNSDTPLSRGVLLGNPGENLRFIGVYGREEDVSFKELNFEKIDAEYDFNGDQSFLERNPQFNIKVDR